MAANEDVLPQRAPRTQRKNQFLSQSLRPLRSLRQIQFMHNRSITAERSSGMIGSKTERRYPIGAELIGNGLVSFRVWAPKAEQLEVTIDGKFQELAREADGYFSGTLSA